MRTWTPSQENAMNVRGKTLLVSAAAGSGKTSVLTERIIRTLTDPKSPADLSRILEINQTTISHQLRFLKSAGIVKCCRQGKIVFYSLANDAVNDVILKGIEFLGC